MVAYYPAYYPAKVSFENTALPSVLMGDDTNIVTPTYTRGVKLIVTRLHISCLQRAECTLGL